MANAKQPNIITNYINNIILEVRTLGISIEVSTDYREFAKIRKGQLDRPPITPLFDHTVANLTNNNFFFIKGTDSTGRVVHLQAARHFDLTGQTLADHIYEYRHAYTLTSRDINIDESEYRMSPISKQMTGNVCYHGENWYHPDFRGTGLSTILPRLLFAVCFSRYPFLDHVFGFILSNLVYCGVLAQYGYTHAQPGGIMWKQTKSDIPITEWVTWISAEDLFHLLKFKPGMECELAEPEINKLQLVAQIDQGMATEVYHRLPKPDHVLYG